MRTCFQRIPDLVVCSLEEEGPFGFREKPSLTWPDDQLWSVKFHRDGTWTPNLCLDPWVWFRGKSEFKNFGSQPTHEVLSAKGSSQKEKSSLLRFKKTTL